MTKIKAGWCTIIVLVCACESGNSEDFVGEYSDTVGGQAQLKITKSYGHYYVALKERAPVGDRMGLWSDTREAAECPGEAIDSMFGKNSAPNVEKGLCMKGAAFGFFKVDKGTGTGSRSFKSDYFAFLAFGGGAMYKLNGTARMLLPIRAEDANARGIWHATITLEDAPPELDGLELSAVIDFESMVIDYIVNHEGQEKTTQGKVQNIHGYSNSVVVTFDVDTGLNGRQRITKYSVAISDGSMMGSWDGTGGQGGIRATKTN